MGIVAGGSLRFLPVDVGRGKGHLPEIGGVSSMTLGVLSVGGVLEGVQEGKSQVSSYGDCINYLSIAVIKHRKST